MAEKMKVMSIKGKNYIPVNERLKAFRNTADFAGFALVTKVHELTADACTMEAQIYDKDGRLVANGFARELRNQAGSLVNATSHVENCETSAWGRALGNLGIGIDESICSAQELLYALQAQETLKNTQQVNNTPQPQNTPQTQGNGQKPHLTQREQDEFDAACAQMDFAIDKDALNRIYYQFKDATFAGMLLEHGMKVKAERGWK